MSKSFFTVLRRYLDSDEWLAEPFTRGQAWVDLIGKAFFKDGHIRVRGVKVAVPRGHNGMSQVQLAKRWRWSRGKVRRFLAELETEQQIEQQKNNITTIIKIINYDLHQLGGTPNGTANGTPSGTTNGQQTDTSYSKENVEKEKNEKNIKTFSSDSDEIRLSVLLFDLISARDEKAKKPDFQKWAKHIDYIIRLDGRPAQDIEKTIRWCQADSFWQNNILCTSKLRKQFAQLWGKMNNNYQQPGGNSDERFGFLDRQGL